VKSKVNGPRIVYLDIETAPIVSYTWGIWDQNVGLNQIIEPWTILSCAWMFEGGKMEYADTRAAKGGPRDDLGLIIQIHNMLSEADICVTQNGIHFDIRRLQARFAELGLPPIPGLRHVDTKVEAKKVFAFVSNKLEWLAEAVGGTKKEKHKKFPGFDLWAEVLKGNVEAWNEMEKYNKQDVKALRKVYLAIRPWMKNHPNAGQYRTDDLRVCPKCGSKHLNARGYSFTTAGKYQRFQCQGCYGWSRGSENLLSPAKRKTLLKGD
jgi:hypothetical protein